MKSLNLVLCALLGLVCTSVFAAKVTDLYQAEILVSGQTHDIREKAVQEAFVDVLMKLTGDFDITKNPVIKENLKKANYYVQDYNYSSASTATYSVLLNVNFVKAEIDQLIRKANIPFWNDERPLILVWLVIHRPKEPVLIASQTNSRFMEAMLNQSKKVGLPLVFPMMDVTDLSQISVADVLEMDQKKLLAAAKRYGADGILVGSIEKTSLNFQSRWVLLINNNHYGWKLDNRDLKDLSHSIINNVTQTVAKKANEENALKETKLTLVINNVNQRDDLINLMKYLQRLPHIKHTRLAKVNRDTIELAVLVRGDVELLKQQTMLGKRLMFKMQIAENNKLLYEWQH